MFALASTVIRQQGSGGGPQVFKALHVNMITWKLSE